MSANWGQQIELSLFGESHGEAIGIVIGHLPAGIKLDEEAIRRDLARRTPGQSELTTSRKETDDFHIISGIHQGYTTGAPLCALFHNTAQHSDDYDALKAIMRPSHADYPAYVKYQGFNDHRGGGMFSGRLTAPLVFAGAIARQILASKGIRVQAHILSIKDLCDDPYPTIIPEDLLDRLAASSMPLINRSLESQITSLIQRTQAEGNSVGGQIECVLTHVPPGIGEPFFDSVESHLAHLLFAVPGVKSVSFGDCDDITRLYGSEANDGYYYQNDQVYTYTNHNGGLSGGITNGMPIIVRVGMKPTPSIAMPQASIDVKRHQNVTLNIKGRHDPCIVLRAVIVIEAMCALAMLDFMGYE
ncbi:MAG: chorismate synthase [bacterium]